MRISTLCSFKYFLEEREDNFRPLSFSRNFLHKTWGGPRRGNNERAHHCTALDEQQSRESLFRYADLPFPPTDLQQTFYPSWRILKLKETSLPPAESKSGKRNTYFKRSRSKIKLRLACFAVLQRCHATVLQLHAMIMLAYRCPLLPFTMCQNPRDEEPVDVSASAHVVHAARAMSKCQCPDAQVPKDA